MNVERPARVRATIRVPADKSISHRALMFNAIADGEATVTGILDSEDIRSTARCLEGLGVRVDWPEGADTARVVGSGLHGLREPEDVLDCGNSGTTIRLLLGLLAGQPFLSILTGDASLRGRPMGRVIHPLRAMGASIQGRRDDTLAPVAIRGGGLRGLEYASPVASAQVKSAILLAGLFADGPSTVVEPAATRNHTELLLRAMGARVETEATRVTVTPPARLNAVSLSVPGDISSAAPWLVLGACHPDAEVTLEAVNINPTRTGLLDILRAMGADLALTNPRDAGGEPVADLVIKSSRLRAATVEGALVPRAIDELPLVAILGCFAEGTTSVRDASELRVKETDRARAVVEILGAMGANIEERGDGFAVHGPAKLRGAAIDAHGDHRMGMLAGIAGALADGTTVVTNDAVAVSYRRFWDDLARATGGVAVG
ncbi:3-phosphoshikimate 1-carboxyvinyltransferase [Tepidiforma sp.]|uniref:3-phosphoshikimate 1-carboxyvinyltransferase n=1 Tax=Tepidiforma sp. TaxID=2682230 RepID=UPI002ADDEC6F|nr:3-phosphoshikimate 1-carboxyvinyltransferase [Tepidiforma sp.]